MCVIGECGLALCRMEFAFELATTKNAGRVFLFASRTASDQRFWISKLGKVLNR